MTNKPVLTDPATEPTPELLAKVLGNHYPLFEELNQLMATRRLTGEWRFYNDGKSWLMKATARSKTVFWLSVGDNSFTVAFYFALRMAPQVNTLPLSAALLQSIQSAQPIGKLFPVAVDVLHPNQLTDIDLLIDFKMKTK
ncbi:MAG: DUF3788 family protein [Bacteroidales bacterium]|nr:DUF3788 family protein [Bacteroidales bacterium]MDD3665075.1 DUF3788 family protein [Bacteroidales bacterium]